MIKTRPLIALVATLFFGAARSGNAQSPVGELHAQEPVQMIVDYGYGQPKHRESRGGMIEPVSVVIGEPVTITLQFLRKRAGESVTVASLDGGSLGLEGPATISADGSVVFRFQAGAAPGLYRLWIAGTEQYQASLYAVAVRAAGTNR